MKYVLILLALASIVVGLFFFKSSPGSGSTSGRPTSSGTTVGFASAEIEINQAHHDAILAAGYSLYAGALPDVEALRAWTTSNLSVYRRIDSGPNHNYQLFVALDAAGTTGSIHTASAYEMKNFEKSEARSLAEEIKPILQAIPSESP